MLTRSQKEKIVKDLITKFANTKLAVLTDYQGLKVNQISDLKKSLKAEGIDFQVAKNTLIKLALKDQKIELPQEIMSRPIALVMGSSDEVMPAKKVAEFSKENDKLEILGGISNGEFVEVEKIKKLASLPGREQLYSMLIARINAPRANFVGVLKANLAGLVNVLKQYHQSINS